MSRSLKVAARAAAPAHRRAAVRRRLLGIGVAGTVLAGALSASGSPAQGAVVCDRSASPSTLATQVSAATAGQTICLAAGDYGTWSGTNKAVTLYADSGVTATMKVNFGAGDSGFTLDGLSGMGGTVTDGAANFTIRNSVFTGSIDLGVSSNANSSTTPSATSATGAPTTPTTSSSRVARAAASRAITSPRAPAARPRASQASTAAPMA
jgi:hypothetical protein